MPPHRWFSVYPAIRCPSPFTPVRNVADSPNPRDVSEPLQVSLNAPWPVITFQASHLLTSPIDSSWLFFCFMNALPRVLNLWSTLVLPDTPCLQLPPLPRYSLMLFFAGESPLFGLTAHWG